jgi:beta-phosphoglucomutase-like phosphatase (HAD superfamily)
VAKGIILDFESIAHRADGDPLPLVREIEDLGYAVYRREFLAACDYVMYVVSARKGLDSAEHFLEAVFDQLDLKPKKTEIMSMAPVFAELHRYSLDDDVIRALPALAKGRKVAVVSCLPLFSVAHALEPVKSHITAIVTPREAKAVPPNPAVYRAALAAMKLRAKDVLLVSPHCEDLAVAKPLGLRPVFVRRQADASCSHAVATIETFEELEAALRPLVKPAPAPEMAAEIPKAPATSIPGK